MIKMICDICKKEVKDQYNFRKLNIAKIVIINNDNSYNTEYEDLEICSECEFEFKKQTKINEAKLITKMKRKVNS